MLGSYRSIIAAIGLVLACANHAYAESNPKQVDPQKAIAESLGKIAANYDLEAKRAQSRNMQTEPCRPGDDRRYSELCAQWKAADAATHSAWWAWASGVAGIGSLVGVLFALRLAFHANWIARDTANRQLRAYIGVDESWIEWDKTTGEFILGVRLKNSGQTPAYNVRVMGEGFAGSYPLKDERPFAPIVEGYESPVNPGADVCCLKQISTTGYDLTMQLVRIGDIGLYIQGICTYEDAFRQSRETRFRYVLGGQPATIAMVMHAARTGNCAT